MHIDDAQGAGWVVRGLRREQGLSVGADPRNVRSIIDIRLRQTRVDLTEDLLRHAGVHDADLVVDIPAGNAAAKVAEQSIRERIHGNLVGADVGEAIH